MKKKLLYCLVLFTGCIHLGTTSQGQTKRDLHFNHISVNDGLSQSTVFSLLQDSRGFIWAGTRTGGLDRFDGYTIVNYSHLEGDSSSISDNEILTLYEDSKGSLWVGTRNGGLNLFDFNQNRFHNIYFQNNEPSTIKTIFESSDGTIWIGGNSGLYTFNYADSSLVEFPHSMTNSKFPHVTSIDGNGKSDLCVGTLAGIYLVDIETRKVYKRYEHNETDDSSLSHNKVEVVRYDASGKLWVGTRKHGLNLFQNGRFKRFGTGEPGNISSKIIRKIEEDDHGNIWIATKHGLNLLPKYEVDQTNPQFHCYRHDEYDSYSLTQNSIYSLMLDNDGSIWLGTWSSGINHAPPKKKKFKHFFNHREVLNSLSDNHVSAFTEDKNGIWIGTEGGGLNYFDPTTEHFVRYMSDAKNTNGLRTNHIKALLNDRDDELWVGTFQGLYTMNKETKQFDEVLANCIVYEVIQPYSSDVWAVTNKGLRVIGSNKQVKASYEHSSGDPHSIYNQAQCILKSMDGVVYIGTKLSFCKYDRQRDRFDHFYFSPSDTTSISHLHVTDIAENSKGQVWVATLRGLNKFNKERGDFTRYGLRSGLPNTAISNLVFDESDNLWITTNEGLSKIEATSLEAGRLLDVKNYYDGDGLQGAEYIQNASFMDKKGQIYLGGVNGLNIVDPGNIQENLKVPKVLFTKFKVFNKQVSANSATSPLKKDISETDSIVLQPDQSSFSFEFVALNFTNPEKNQYAYRMKGFDKDWIYSGTHREASYTNMPAGDYVLEVKASNNDGYWNEKGATIYIRLLPYWWETLWFKLVLLSACLFLVFYLLKSKASKHELDKSLLSKEIEKATWKIKEKNEVLENEQKKLKRAIDETNRAIGKILTSGKFQEKISVDDKEGKWRQLAESINSLLKLISIPFAEVNEVISALAMGDLTKRYHGKSKGDLKLLTDNVNTAANSLDLLVTQVGTESKIIGEASSDMLEGAKEMNVNTSEISVSISQMSHSFIEQQHKIDESSAYLDEILVSSMQMMQDAETINYVASEGNRLSRNGTELMRQLNNRVEEVIHYSDQSDRSIEQLLSASYQITTVVRIIKEIASQTNLLALNASIQASQAGPAGKGFAVVAEEIRKLAEGSERSVTEIEELIFSVQENTKSTADIIRKMGKEIQEGRIVSEKSKQSFEEISEHCLQTFSKSEEIVEKVNEQTLKVQNMVRISSEAVAISEENSAGSEQIAASAAELAAGMNSYTQKAQQVFDIIQKLESQIGKFTFNDQTEPESSKVTASSKRIALSFLPALRSNT